MARQMVVEVAGDASKFGKATNDAIGHAKSFNSVLAGFGAGIGLKIFDTLAEGVKMAMDKIKESDKIFRDDQASAVLLGQAMKDNIKNFAGGTDAAEKFVESQARLGVDAVTARDSLGQLLGVTHNLTQAEKLQTLALDFARAHHLDLATATDIVAKASEGNFKALKKYGIEVKAATDHVDALTHSHHKYTPAQLASAKAADLAETKARALKGMYDQTKGSAEAYANTAQGKLEAANAKNTASWVKIGAIVNRVSSVILPIVADAFAAVADKVAPLADWISDHLFPAFQQISKFVQDIFGPDIKDITANFGDLVPVLKFVGSVLLVVFAVIGGAILLVIKGVLLLVRAIEIFAHNTAQNINTVKGYFNGLVSFVTGLPAAITKAAKGIWNGLLGEFKSVYNKIADYINKLIGAFNALPHLGAPNIPTLPRLHTGGIVPGAPGSEVPMMLQAGEEVRRAGSRSGGGEIHIHMHGTVIDGPAMDRFFNEGLRRARVAPGR